MDRVELKKILRVIGLALNASHNTIATDDPGAVPVEDYSWRIDHSEEIKLLERLKKDLLS